MAGSSVWSLSYDFTVNSPTAPSSPAFGGGAEGFFAQGNGFATVARPHSDLRTLPAQKTSELDRHRMDPLSADLALASFHDKAESAVAPQSRGIQTQAHVRTIDKLALMRTQRRNENAHDEQDLADDALALWPDSEWWESA
jgi:hypothetical protein